MSTILDRYEINFYRKTDKNPFTGLSEVEPIIDTLNDRNFILASFFSDYYRERDVQEYILDVIESVVNQSVTEGQTGSQSGVHVWILSSNAKFVYFDGAGSYMEPDLTIPTQDFKQLASEWKNFIANV